MIVCMVGWFAPRIAFLKCDNSDIPLSMQGLSSMEISSWDKELEKVALVEHADQKPFGFS